MFSSPAAAWLDVLWEAVCLRAKRPIPGILVDLDGVSKIANETFATFLDAGGDPEPKLQQMLGVLTAPVKSLALDYVSERRGQTGDSNLFRDPAKLNWEVNPAFPQLIQRGKGGELVDAGWALAEPVLWQRVGPVYRRLRLNSADARDVYSETIADFLKARPSPAECPMREMRVFEELPRLFAVVAERRAISWLRKQTTLKNQPNVGGVSFDDPDVGLGNQIAEPRSLSEEDPLCHAHFDTIRRACGDVLSDLEWVVIEALFVEGSRTRDELAVDEWILEQLEVAPSASRSTRLRRLNSLIADSLARLGRRIEEVDL